MPAPVTIVKRLCLPKMICEDTQHACTWGLYTCPALVWRSRWRPARSPPSWSWCFVWCSHTSMWWWWCCCCTVDAIAVAEAALPAALAYSLPFWPGYLVLWLSDVLFFWCSICLMFYMSDAPYFLYSICLMLYMSDVLYFWCSYVWCSISLVFCLVFYMSDVPYVWCSLCLVFHTSGVLYVWCSGWTPQNCCLRWVWRPTVSRLA